MIFFRSKFLAGIIFSCLMAMPLSSYAAGAANFIGLYKVQGGGDGDYLLVDVDLLKNIWDRYADSELPESLEPYKDESAILAGFTHVEWLMLGFEQLATVTERYLRMTAPENELFELFKQDDGNYKVAVRKNGNVIRYLLEPPRPIPAQLQSFKPRFSELELVNKIQLLP